MKKVDNIFLYPNKIPIKGFCRSTIYDLREKKVSFIPNDLFNLLNNNFSSHKNDFIPDEYFSFLLKEKIIYTGEERLFSELSKKWKSPSFITNIIISLTPQNINHISNCSDIFDDILCKNIQIQVDLNITEFELETLLDKFNQSSILYIELVFYKRKIKFSIDQLRKFCETNPRVLNFIIEDTKNSIEYLDFKKVISVTYCEFKNNFFVIQDPNLSLFTESQKHNTYFNRKLYIGKEGEIKNAPECEKEFGYIQEIKDVEELKQIISNSTFQKYWFIHKDLIDVCKDCEFRHTCVDSRLPYQRKDTSWYHKKECDYNPYICKWKGEKDYKTLEKCGVIVNKNGYSINRERITNLNKELWAE